MNPQAKEEPQILDHPEGIGENTLAYWRPSARLEVSLETAVVGFD